MKIKSAKGFKKKCDQLVREILLIRESTCQRCRSTNHPQAAHIVSRRYSATRCDLDNLWRLCAGCHLHIHNWPDDHMALVEATIGLKKYKQLRSRAEKITKMDWEAECTRLQGLLTEHKQSGILQPVKRRRDGRI